MTATTSATSSSVFTYQHRPTSWTYTYTVNPGSTTSNYTGRVDTALTPEQVERAKRAEEERKRKAAEREAEFDAVFEV